MADAIVTSLERDGEVRPFAAHGQAVIGTAGAMSMSRATFEPGWRWSQHVGPIVGGDTCQVRHLGYVVSGQMQVRFDDGTEVEIGPGDLFDAPAGHDAWVIGDEPCVLIDVSPDSTRYARGGATVAKSEDRYLSLVRKGFAAFNAGDMATLSELMARDVVHHTPGKSPMSGAHKGIEAVFAYYGQIAEQTNGTARAHLIDAHSDGEGHVAASFVQTGTRNGVTRATRATILFTFVGDKAIDLLELSSDLAGDDAFWS